jgi:2-hydroxychromene-2-carboxylate isomerase
MARTIDFYFDFISPYSYLAHTQLPKIAARTGCTLAYHAVDLQQLKIRGGNTGPSSREQPLKSRYNLADFGRWSRRYGVPIKRPSGYDPRHRLNKGAFLAQERGQIGAYVTAAWRRVWGEGGNLADENLMRAVAGELGWNADEYLAYTLSDAAEQKFQASTDEAHGRGVFGVPAMLVGEELFWGNDRLDFLEEHLASVTPVS